MRRAGSRESQRLGGSHLVGLPRSGGAGTPPRAAARLHWPAGGAPRSRRAPGRPLVERGLPFWRPLLALLLLAAARRSQRAARNWLLQAKRQGRRPARFMCGGTDACARGPHRPVDLGIGGRQRGRPYSGAERRDGRVGSLEGRWRAWRAASAVWGRADRRRLTGLLTGCAGAESTARGVAGWWGRPPPSFQQVDARRHILDQPAKALQQAAAVDRAARHDAPPPPRQRVQPQRLGGWAVEWRGCARIEAAEGD